MCPVGLQTMEINQALKSGQGRGGFCGAWSLWYLDQRLAHPELSPYKVEKIAVDAYKENNISLRDFIVGYMWEVNSELNNLKISGNTNIHPTFHSDMMEIEQQPGEEIMDVGDTEDLERETRRTSTSIKRDKLIHIQM